MHFLKTTSSIVAALAVAALTIGCGEEARGYSGGSSAPATMEAVGNTPAIERQIIRRGNLTVRVPDPDQAERDARTITASLGGFVESSSLGNRESQVRRTNLTVRVPVARFDQVMADFGRLGKRLSASESAEDVTLQMVDLDARLKTMQAEEESLREMLRAARSVDASIRVHERLSKVRGEIESMAGQRKALGRQAAMSTILLEIESDPRVAAAGNASWSQDAWANARTAATELTQLAGTVGIFFLVLWPLWAVPLVAIALGVWSSRRRAAA